MGKDNGQKNSVAKEERSVVRQVEKTVIEEGGWDVVIGPYKRIARISTVIQLQMMISPLNLIHPPIIIK